MNIIGMTMMNVGELFTRVEMIKATSNYQLVWKDPCNVLFLLSDGVHFDVFCYVDVQYRQFEHIYSSEDHDYPITRVISALKKYGFEIASAHLSEDDCYLGGTDAWFSREDIEDLLIMTKRRKATRSPIAYAVSSNKGYGVYYENYNPISKWVTHTQHIKEIMVDKVGVHEFTLEVKHMYRPSFLKDRTVTISDGKLVDVKTLTYYVTDRSFTPEVVNPYPISCSRWADYKKQAEMAWVRSIVDANGDVVERVRL